MTFPVESICYSARLFWVPVAAVAGGSTGSGQIAQSRSLEMPLRIDLPVFLLDIVTNGR